jgi:carboxypeptidase C (cathepsin A)
VPANHTAEPPSPSGSAFVHYWLVENAAKDPNAPTLVWQQGGPGGSSLIGLFTEVGPITLNDHSFAASAGYSNESAIPTVFDNPFSWHTSPANMLFVEHPAPTGFSYCVPMEACTWDDENQAPINYQFYVKFFELYPELAHNEFYFSGESYAGVLVPTVALQILAHKTPSNEHLAPHNLGGFAIGNGAFWASYREKCYCGHLTEVWCDRLSRKSGLYMYTVLWLAWGQGRVRLPVWPRNDS